MGFFRLFAPVAYGGSNDAQLKYANDLAIKDSLVIPEETPRSGKSLFQRIENIVGKSQSEEQKTRIPQERNSQMLPFCLALKYQDFYSTNIGSSRWKDDYNADF